LTHDWEGVSDWVVIDLSTYGARIQALLAQRAAADAELTRWMAEVDKIEGEINAVAKELAEKTGAKARMAPSAQTDAKAASSVDAPAIVAAVADGAAQAAEATSPPTSAWESAIATAGAATLAEAQKPPSPPAEAPRMNGGHLVHPPDRLAPKKLELLKLLLANQNGAIPYFAHRMYGEDTRQTRVNVSSYFSELKTSGHVEAGATAGSFKVTPKGVAAAANGR
jgi:hypothetical protein